MTSYSEFVLNCERDTEDERDYKVEFNVQPRISRLLGFTRNPNVIVPPPTVDLRKHMSPIENQGNIGSCTAFTVGSAHEMKQHQAKRIPIVILSKLFLYYEARKIAGNQEKDSGSHIRDAMKVIGTIGVPPQKIYPYDIKKWNLQPH